MELGNLMFNTNKNQSYECPRYVGALLEAIDNLLCIKMWNKNQEEYESPFKNTGNRFENDVFIVEAYSWNEEYEQQYNFKWQDVEISWYKYLGRDTTINKKITPKEAVKMFNECIESLECIEED